jgi:hypothetical protein
MNNRKSCEDWEYLPRILLWQHLFTQTHHLLRMVEPTSENKLKDNEKMHNLVGQGKFSCLGQIPKRKLHNFKSL